MNKFLLTFHHLGLATSQEKAAIKFLQNLGFEIGESIYDPLQKVTLRMCENEEHPNIELITQDAPQGPLSNMLQQNEALTYHYCYSTPNVDETIRLMRTEGVRVALLSRPKPAVLFGGKKVSFLTVRGMGVIELLEQDIS